MLEIFQSVQKWSVDKERLNSLWREGDIENAVFLSMWEDILSGPIEVLTLREHSSFSTSACVHSIVDKSGWEYKGVDRAGVEVWLDGIVKQLQK